MNERRALHGTDEVDKRMRRQQADDALAAMSRPIRNAAISKRRPLRGCFDRAATLEVPGIPKAKALEPPVGESGC